MHVAGDGGLNRSQSSVLRELSSAGTMTLSQLAEQISVTNQSMTTISDKLVRMGYAERVYDENNRRQIQLKLTETGKEYVTQNILQIIQKKKSQRKRSGDGSLFCNIRIRILFRIQ